MGKKQIKKNVKRQNQTIKNDIKLGGLHPDVKKFLIIFLVVITVIGIGYGTLYKIYGPKDEKNTDESAKSEVLKGHKILAQDTFSQTGDYFVIFINGDDGKDVAEQYFSLNVNSGTKAYYVDMNDPLNKNYKHDDTVEKKQNVEVVYNKQPTNADELDIYEYPTVIQVSNGTLVGYYENDEVYQVLGIPNPKDQQQQLVTQ